MRNVTIFLILFWGTSLFSQRAMDTLAEEYIKELEHSLPKDLFESEEGGTTAIDLVVSKAFSNEKRRIRAYAQYKIKEIGARNKSLSVKRKAVNLLLKFSFDPALDIRDNNSTAYQAFPKEAYTRDFVMELKSILHNDSFVNRGHILLVGFLELTEEKDHLESHFVRSSGRFLNDFSLGDINRFDFAARMALARMGDTEQGKYVIGKIMEVPEPEVLKHRLKYLAYIKRPEAVEILIQYLFDDGTMYDINGLELPKANFVLGTLYKLIEGFPGPAPIDRTFCKEEDVTKARNWITANRTTYKINRNTW